MNRKYAKIWKGILVILSEPYNLLQGLGDVNWKTMKDFPANSFNRANMISATLQFSSQIHHQSTPENKVKGEKFSIHMESTKNGKSH